MLSAGQTGLFSPESPINNIFLKSQKFQTTNRPLIFNAHSKLTVDLFNRFWMKICFAKKIIIDLRFMCFLFFFK